MIRHVVSKRPLISLTRLRLLLITRLCLNSGYGYVTCLLHGYVLILVTVKALLRPPL